MNRTYNLTKAMIGILFQIYERERSGEDPFGHELKYISGLYRRGLIDVRLWGTEKRKYYMAFFLTDAGKKTLEHLNKNY